MKQYYLLAIMAIIAFFFFHNINNDNSLLNYSSNSVYMNETKASDTSLKDQNISDEKPKLISDKFSFTEGPAVDEEGNVFFTDQPNNQIWKYDINGKLSLFMNDCGRSNGMYFDKVGNLISCADEHNQLWSIAPDKKINILVKNFKGEILNGPNDVWVNYVNGDIYFTDPFYKRDYWNKDHSHMEKQNTYYLAKGSQEISLADSTLQKPNGIVGSADGKYLFIADIGAGKTYKFEIGKNGILQNKQLFVNQGSDGITLDDRGNVYLTGKGVTVYNSNSKMIQQIPINEDWTGNICFGGKDRKDLFITASKSLYKLSTKVKGL